VIPAPVFGHLLADSLSFEVIGCIDIVAVAINTQMPSILRLFVIALCFFALIEVFLSCNKILTRISYSILSNVNISQTTYNDEQA
jgi:hypothetical protein